jgi:hypothetical protein
MALGTFKNLGNNVVLEKMDYRMAGNIADENKLLNLLNGGEAVKRQHLGILTLFNQFQLVNTPFLKMTELEKNTIYTNGDNGEFTFDIPYTLEMPSIRQDLTGDSDRVGIDGQPFEVVIGDGNIDPIFGVNEIITNDLRDGQNFIVLEVGSRIADGFVYKLRLVTNDKAEAVDKSALKPGTQLFSVNSAIGQYDEDAGGVNMSAGFIRLLHKQGAKRAVKMQIHGSAQRLKLDGLSGVDSKDVNQFEATVAPYLDPKNPNFMVALGFNNGQGKIDRSKGVSFVTMVEVLMYKQLMLQTERALMWAQGGVLQDQRNNFKIVAPGLYQQMKNGNWYPIPKYTLDVVKGVFSQIFKNRPDIADVDRHIHFQCGRGAVNELTRICTEAGIQISNAIGTILDNSSLGIIKGKDAYNLEAGYRFNKVFLSGFGHLSFEHNPALDSEYTRDMDAERIGGIPKFSYTSMVFDVTDQISTNAYKPSKDVDFATGIDNRSNIYLIRNAAMPGVKYSYVNGRTSPYALSAGKGNVVSTLYDGYVSFLEEQSSVWLRDPGRSVLITLQ